MIDEFGRNFIKYKKLKPEELQENIILAREGDDFAFSKVLSHMKRYLEKLEDEFFIQGGDKDDVFQEGAVKLLNVIQKYDPEKGSFNSFAQSSIRKHIITSINREQAQKRLVLNRSHSLNVTMSSSDPDCATTFLDNLPDERKNNSNPLDIVQKDYEDYLISEISKVLSKMETKVFYLRFIERDSYKDIALKLGFVKYNKEGKELPDQKAVDNAIMRSRPKIKKVLEKLNLAPKDFLDEIDDVLIEEDKPKNKTKKIIAKKKKTKKLEKPKKKTSSPKTEEEKNDKPKKRGRPPKKKDTEPKEKIEDKPKKKRGRPPKKVAETIKPPKKKRGRPPKKTVKVAETPRGKRGRPPKKAVEIIEPPKKRRGRPPKIQKEEIVPKKKRGRPPKKVVEAPKKKRGRPKGSKNKQK